MQNNPIRSKPKCPRRGAILLTTQDDQTLAVQTSCKTWGCPVCRKKLNRLVQMRMIYGCLMAEHSYFITVTYRAGPLNLIPDADSVQKDLKALLSRMKSIYPNLAWFKITELTRMGVPHLHLLVTGLHSSQANCLGRMHPWGKAWLQDEACQCMEHQWSRAWHEVTRESYVTAVRKIYEIKGVARYLSKYLLKAFNDREQMAEMGFMRRWSCSRNWPRSDLHIAGAGTWKKVQRVSGYMSDVVLSEWAEVSKDHPLLEKLGNETVMAIEAMYQADNNMKLVEMIGGYLNANVSQNGGVS